MLERELVRGAESPGSCEYERAADDGALLEYPPLCHRLLKSAGDQVHSAPAAMPLRDARRSKRHTL